MSKLEVKKNFKLIISLSKNYMGIHTHTHTHAHTCTHTHTICKREITEVLLLKSVARKEYHHHQYHQFYLILYEEK